MKKIAIVFNQKSGFSLTDKKAEIEQACKDCGVAYEFVQIDKKFEVSLDTLRERFAYEIVVAAGGDGTVNAVANYVLKHDLPMAVLPVGTLNHFAKESGAPLTIAEAMQKIAEGTMQTVDVSDVNGTYFVNNSSVGFYPAMVHRREKLQKYITKWPALLVAFVTELFVLRRHRAELSIDGKKVEHKVSFIFIGNNSYEIEAGSFQRVNNLQEGQLCVYVLKTAKFSKMLRIVWRVLRGKLNDETAFETYTARSVRIEWPKSAAYVAFDGEVRHTQTPLVYTIHPQSLQVIIS